jgi:hypothetical protein
MSVDPVHFMCVELYAGFIGGGGRAHLPTAPISIPVDCVELDTRTFELMRKTSRLDCTRRSKVGKPVDRKTG